MHITHIQLFQTTKIQIFESNSQRYDPDLFVIELFQTTKIQIFESNSQRLAKKTFFHLGCFRLQRYKFLKAIHNRYDNDLFVIEVVSDYKDTNF